MHKLHHISRLLCYLPRQIASEPPPGYHSTHARPNKLSNNARVFSIWPFHCEVVLDGQDILTSGVLCSTSEHIKLIGDNNVWDLVRRLGGNIARKNLQSDQRVRITWLRSQVSCKPYSRRTPPSPTCAIFCSDRWRRYRQSKPDEILEVDRTGFVLLTISRRICIFFGTSLRRGGQLLRRDIG